MGRNHYRGHQSYGGNRGNGSEGRRYDGHDDRDGNNGSNRGNRVWTRGGGGGGGVIHNRLGPRQVNFEDDGPRGGGISKRNRGGKNSNRNIHIVLPEDDEDMNNREAHGGEQAGRARPSYISRRGNRVSFPGGRNRTCRGPGRIPPGIIAGRAGTSINNVFSWQKVVLKNGSKYDKIVLLKELLAKSNTKFIPICYTKQGMNTYFFLEDGQAARALKDLDKQLEMPDGYQLGITVERSTPPNMPLTDELVEKIKVVMSKRYIQEHKALNLKSFHLDEDFAGESFYAPLWRSNVMNKVLTVIADHIPELYALDLSSNKLNSMSLEFFSTFKSKVTNMRILHLADNKMMDVRGLERMKGMELIELKLTGNPLVDKLGSSYTSSIRKIFPSLQKLDDRELPKEIGFEEDDEETKTKGVPASIQKYVKNSEAEKIVLTFLEQYIKLYDSESRQPLLDAYHDEAVMSLSAFGRHDLLPAYIPESRNLKRVEYEKKRHDLLRRGKLAIVAFLAKLPKTEHDITTFTLDVPFCSANLMTFTVTGLFRERDTKLKESIRHFNRCFIVVPQGAGFSIINETLYISTATDLSTRKAFVTPPPAPVAPALDDATKQTLSAAFSEKSGMNLEWSVKCLEQNSWDFDKSAAVFSEAKKLGKIPDEAFLK